MRAKLKSPNYPGVDLSTAIELARKLFSGEVGRGEFTPDDAARAWDYSSVSGPVRVRIGALRQYGLIERVEGSRISNAKLSRRALVLVLHQPGSEEYREAIREAALAPPLFKETFETHPNAADGVLRQFLVIDKNFTDYGVNRFVKSYKRTLSLASLDAAGQETRLKLAREKDGVSTGSGGASEKKNDEVAEIETPGADKSMKIPIPIFRDRVVTVIAPIDIDSSDWENVYRILDAYSKRADAGDS